MTTIAEQQGGDVLQGACDKTEGSELVTHHSSHITNRTVRLRPDGFQKGFGGGAGFPLFKIVGLTGFTDDENKYWMGSTVTRKQMESLGYTVEII